MSCNELIVCENVSLGYEGQSVLTGLDLTIRAGDYLCIVGDNGSGKSTLLRGLLGLIAPQSGTIRRAPELEKLEAAGRVHKVHTEEGAFFQFCPHPEADHGCFLLRCEACGRMVHLDCGHLEDLCRHLEAQHHFRIDPRQTILTGRCRSCVEKESVHELQ